MQQQQQQQNVIDILVEVVPEKVDGFLINDVINHYFYSILIKKISTNKIFDTAFSFLLQFLFRHCRLFC
jgi:hypothetical protein